MEPWLVPTCLCMCLSILPPPHPQRSLRVGCGFYGYCSSRAREEQLDAGAGRTHVSLWISQKLDRESVFGGATTQDKDSSRENLGGKPGVCWGQGLPPTGYP